MLEWVLVAGYVGVGSGLGSLSSARSASARLVGNVGVSLWRGAGLYFGGKYALDVGRKLYGAKDDFERLNIAGREAPGFAAAWYGYKGAEGFLSSRFGAERPAGLSFEVNKLPAVKNGNPYLSVRHVGVVDYFYSGKSLVPKARTLVGVADGRPYVGSLPKGLEFKGTFLPPVEMGFGVGKSVFDVQFRNM